MAIVIRRTRNQNPEREWMSAGSSIGAFLFRGWIWFKGSGKNLLLKLLVASFLLTTWYMVFLGADPNDPFARPFCDVDGVCHELPDKPSPRTAYSAWNKKQYHLWWTYYETLKERVDEYATKRQALYDKNPESTDRSRPLILLGDSITESWSGTGLGIHKVRAEGVPKILEDELTSSRLDPIVLGESGDQTQHLLYRLQNGHMHAAEVTDGDGYTHYDPQAIFVIMIGTNNLGSGELPGPTANGVLAVVDYILQETAEAGCHVMVFNLLPRGDGRNILPTLCPPRCDDMETETPYSSFLPAINKVNDEVAKGINIMKAMVMNTGRVEMIDCGKEFLNPDFDPKNDATNNDDYEVKTELMPDLLHPNARGHQILAKCIQDYVKRIDDKRNL